MALFDNLKKEHTEKRESIHVPYVIVGQDWSSVKLYNFLKEKYGKDQILILDHKDFHFDYRFFQGPSINRGEENKYVLKSFFPNIEFKDHPEPLFYKDQKFRSFKGKAKPLKIFDDELFFQRLGFDFNHDHLFTKDEDPSKENLNYLKGTIEAIQENEPLVESESFKNNKILIKLEGGKDIVCNQIFFGYSLNSLLNLIDKNTQLGSHFHPYATEIFSRPCMVVEFQKLDHSNFEGSYYIPQSQTHERGNFIVQASNIPGKHDVRCFAGIEREEFNEEELSKKIKLLKRTLERVFEDFNSVNYQEKITFFHSSPLSQPVQIDERFSNLIFISGQHGFVPESFLETKNLNENFARVDQDARALTTLEFIKSFV